MGFTSRTVNLSWAPPPDNHNLPITHYLIHMRVGEKGHWDSRHGILTRDNRTYQQIINLLPFTVYSFRVFAVNKMGRSKPSIESYYMVTLREGNQTDYVFGDTVFGAPLIFARQRA
ncbi:myosin-binding protein H-like [Schistocerca cancellata]|uniref:myosin-binding protein H-like n=1 Tax=Schistocerca cancellata TaxID=274614 RepID=UPI002118BE35|nr:myosin-binding protein H-like [Schistocerca cancellata]